MPRDSYKVKTPEQALASAERVCARMERTAGDVRRSLVRWGVTDPAVQRQIVEKLVAAGFVDHRRYAGAFVREKFRLARWSEQKIRAALRLKGIEREWVEEAIEENIDKNLEQEQFLADARRRFEALKGKAKSPYDLRVKLFRWAASKGYSADKINTVLNNITGEDYE